MLKIFKTRYFTKWQTKNGIADATLVQAISELSSDLHDGQLARFLYKKRIGKRGFGKRAGYRCIIACRYEDRAFFIYGYAKNKKANISPQENIAFKDAADILLSKTETELEMTLNNQECIEVPYV